MIIKYDEIVKKIPNVILASKDGKVAWIPKAKILKTTSKELELMDDFIPKWKKDTYKPRGDRLPWWIDDPVELAMRRIWDGT